MNLLSDYLLVCFMLILTFLCALLALPPGSISKCFNDGIYCDEIEESTLRSKMSVAIDAFKSSKSQVHVLDQIKRYFPNQLPRFLELVTAGETLAEFFKFYCSQNKTLCDLLNGKSKFKDKLKEHYSKPDVFAKLDEDGDAIAKMVLVDKNLVIDEAYRLEKSVGFLSRVKRQYGILPSEIDFMKHIKEALNIKSEDVRNLHLEFIFSLKPSKETVKKAVLENIDKNFNPLIKFAVNTREIANEVLEIVPVDNLEIYLKVVKGRGLLDYQSIGSYFLKNIIHLDKIAEICEKVLQKPIEFADKEAYDSLSSFNRLKIWNLNRKLASKK